MQFFLSFILSFFFSLHNTWQWAAAQYMLIWEWNENTRHEMFNISMYYTSTISCQWISSLMVYAPNKILFSKIYLHTHITTATQKILYGLHMVHLLVGLFEIHFAARPKPTAKHSHLPTHTHTVERARARNRYIIIHIYNIWWYLKRIHTSLALKAYHKLKVECVTCVRYETTMWKLVINYHTPFMYRYTK